MVGFSSSVNIFKIYSGHQYSWATFFTCSRFFVSVQYPASFQYKVLLNNLVLMIPIIFFAEQGWQNLRTHLAIETSFQQKKEFQKFSKIDQVRGKNVNCATTFQQLPLAQSKIVCTLRCLLRVPARLTILRTILAIF